MYKLLLADDSTTIQRVIELTFSGEDVEVISVGDGEQAIARIPAERPDIVLADIGMPKRSGYDVAAFVKGHAELSHIPVLLLAGAFEPVDDARAELVRCDGVLVKPFEPQQVIARVHELIEGGKGTPSSGIGGVPRPVTRLTPPRPAGLANVALAERVTQVAQAPPATAFRPAEAMRPAEAAVLTAPVPPSAPQPSDPFNVAARMGAAAAVTFPQPQLREPEAYERVVPSAPGAEVRLAEEQRPAPRQAETAFPEARFAVPQPPQERFAAAERQAPPVAPPPVAPSPMAQGFAPPPLVAPQPPVPPAALPRREEPPVVVPADSLDDYFDRLDAAFATLGSGQANEGSGASQAAADDAGLDIPTLDHVLGSGAREARTGSPAFGGAARSLELVPPPQAPVSQAAAPPAPPPDGGGRSLLAQAFNALLAVEQGESSTNLVRLTREAPPPVVTEAMVEEVTRRVLLRLSPDSVRGVVADIVSEIAERLVREEIHRIRGGG